MATIHTVAALAPHTNPNHERNHDTIPVEAWPTFFTFTCVIDEMTCPRTSHSRDTCEFTRRGGTTDTPSDADSDSESTGACAHTAITEQSTTTAHKSMPNIFTRSMMPLKISINWGLSDSRPTCNGPAKFGN